MVQGSENPQGLTGSHYYHWYFAGVAVLGSTVHASWLTQEEQGGSLFAFWDELASSWAIRVGREVKNGRLMVESWQVTGAVTMRKTALGTLIQTQEMGMTVKMSRTWPGEALSL